MGVGEGGTQLYLRSLDDFEDRPIPVPANSGGAVFFSSDSKSIGFFADNKLKKTSLAGGISHYAVRCTWGWVLRGLV